MKLKVRNLFRTNILLVGACAFLFGSSGTAKTFTPLSLSQLKTEREKNKEATFARHEVYGEAWVVNSSPSLGSKKIFLVSPDPFAEPVISFKTGAFYLELQALPAHVSVYPGQKLNIRGKILDEEENELWEVPIFTLDRTSVQILSVEPKSLVLPKTFSLSLERQACAGPCPEYKVSVDQSGLMRFEGKEHVKSKEVKTKTISTENLKRLWEIVEKTKFFSLSEKYYNEVNVDKGAPIYVVNITTPEQSKTVSHEEGNPQAPVKLILLENAIDELLETRSFIH